MKVQIKIVTENPQERELLRNYYESKRLNHATDSGLDLVCPRQISIRSGETKKVPLGIACQIIHEEYPHGYYLYPRSSIIKTPMRLANSVGIIDYGYRGEITAVVDYYPNNSVTNNEPFVIEPGTRYFQLCSPNLTPLEFEIVEELGNTQRGQGGFGSTN